MRQRLVRVVTPAGALAVSAGLLSVAVVPWFPNGALAKWWVLAACLPLLAFVDWRTKWDRVDLCAALMVGWAGLSILWSSDPLFGLYRLLQCGIMLALFLGLRRYRGPIGPAAFVAALVTLATTWLLPFGSFQNENFISEFLILCAPFVLLVRWTVAVPLLGALCAYLGANESRVEFAAIAGLLIAGTYALGGKYRLLTPALIVLALAAIVYLGGDAGTYRLQLWTNSLGLWFQNPFGHGLGSLDYIYPTFSEFDAAVLGGGGARASGTAGGYVGATHNEVLQILVELGIVGGALGLLLLRYALRHPKTPEQIACVASLALAAGIAMIEFPLQTPGGAAVIVLALARLSPAEAGEARSWLPRASLAALSLAGVSLLTLAAMGQQWFARVNVHLNDAPITALQANAEAYRWFPWDKQVRLQYFRTLATVQERYPSAVIDRGTAESIYAISRSAVPNNVGLMIDRIAYLNRSGRCAEECARIYADLGRQTMVVAVSDLLYRLNWTNEPMTTPE